MLPIDSRPVAVDDVLPGLRAGIPRLPEVEALIRGESYAAMERASEAFRVRHAATLAGYSRRWTPDPLRGWSRRWEYPFVLGWIETIHRASGDGPLTLLDAGSGATFFPFHVVTRVRGARVRCVDADPTLTAVFQGLTTGDAGGVTFTCGRLQRLPAEDRSVDVLYCISVLEHTDDYDAVLAEFARVLRPGGTLIVTFDVSRDGRTDVAPDGAVRLLETIERRFEPVARPRVDTLRVEIAAPDALTTAWARRHRPESLPWRGSWRGSLRSLARLRWPRAPFFDCTVCGAVYRRQDH